MKKNVKETSKHKLYFFKIKYNYLFENVEQNYNCNSYFLTILKYNCIPTLLRLPTQKPEIKTSKVFKL